MKVAYDHRAFTTRRFGGVSRYFVEVARRLALREDVDVRVVAPLHLNEHLRELASPPRIGVYVPPVRWTGRFRQHVNDAIGRTLIATFAPAIVHETYYANHSIAPRRSKRVVTVYDFIDERTRNSNPKTDPRSRAKVATIRRADLIICISHNTRRDLLEFLEEIDPARVFVVHLGHSLPTQPRSSRPIARPYVLFVGRRNGYKNFSRLATAYAASSRLRELDLVSFGGGAWSSEERALFRQLDLDEARVHLFSGSDAFLATLYTHAAVFAYPSVYEGFGIPPLEAMGYGCATVCARSSSLPEVAGDATEYCEPLDVDSIRDALERALEPTRRAELIERGKARLANFTWDECAVQTLRVYQRLSAR